MASRVEEVERLLGEMSRAEKAQILDRIVRDLGDAFPGIERTERVCGGQAVIVRTRIPVWLLELARRAGASDAELLHAYPSLPAEDIAHASAYARAHPAEIDQAIAENDAA